MTEHDIEKLLEQLEQHPDDDKLLAIIALHYIENPEGNKDLEYLEKAYQTNPSIENTHNLAFWLDHEYGEEERSIQLQEQAIFLQPHSYYPYASYAQMLTFSTNCLKDNFTSKSVECYRKIISYNQLALDKLSNIAVNHKYRHVHKYFYFYNNMACAYVMLDNYEQACEYFAKSMNLMKDLLISDVEILPILVLEENIYYVLLNQIRLHILLGDRANALVLLTEAKQSSSYCELEIAELYARLGDYQTAYEISINENVDESWEWIFYAIYQANQENWIDRLTTNYQDKLSLLAVYNLEVKRLKLDGTKSLDDELNNIKQQEIKISKLARMMSSNIYPKPKENIKSTFRSMYCGCLLFGCWIHGCLVDDSNKWYE
ncbi:MULTISPECIES: hypothetical protein [unclassified Psychrobacter]|uniref:hypothetical protein n=1 Tax=unclassified Psychrobacter TaxID=196806 RepID=UPI0025B5B5C8|nr:MULTISPECIES: hypothetical protein [unclassified Psychrobacter]MDN3452185.1 hypothetical protein [Psychrobacter sp. APC 3350]MDN3501244.1 hypothetical protein [Psychrobacter sp. 5A.1]